MPSSVDPLPTVIIAGAGFSGAVTAAQLLRGARSPLRVVLVNRSGRMARGLAYGTRSEQHVLNVPAGRMSAYPDDDGHFLRYAQRCDPAVTGGSFVPRQLYGEYLESLLDVAAKQAATGARLERVVDEIGDVEVMGAGVEVTLGSGLRLRADRLVLAVGNYAPADPVLADGSVLTGPRYVRDPWVPGALEVATPDQPVLLVGTGLTMLDIALDLRARGRSAPMHAVSRRGLLPQPHRESTPPPTFQHRPPDIEAVSPTAVDLLRSVRRHVRHAAEAGVDWRDVIAALRPITPALWHRLNERERARFLRHLRVYWDVHRHRAAPRPAALLQRMLADGELQVHAARLVAAAERGGRLRVTIRRRGAATDEQIEVGAVVNCTGPQSDIRRLDDPLMNALQRRGLVRPDPLGLGIAVAEDGALLDANGRLLPAILHVGPLLKARDWEATAVPELRRHAAAAATAILDTLQPR